MGKSAGMGPGSGGSSTYQDSAVELPSSAGEVRQSGRTRVKGFMQVTLQLDKPAVW